MPAAFEFLRYQIVKLEYNVNPDVEIHTTDQKVDTQVSLARNTENLELFRLVLNITIHGNPHVKLEMFGYFKINGDYLPDETEKAIITYGTSIIYPYARVAISSVSVFDGGQPIIIGTINFHDLVIDKVENDQKLENG
jgi:preprotein translocase subunit SecB